MKQTNAGRRGHERGLRRLELDELAIGPSSRTHDGAKCGDSTDESQCGQARHQEKTAPNIMEDRMIHDGPLLLVIVLLSTPASAGDL